MLVMRPQRVRAALRSGQNGHLVAAEGWQKGWRVRQGWGLLGLACKAKRPLQRCAPVRANVRTGQKREETPFGINLMRRLVLHQAAPSQCHMWLPC